MEGEDLYRQAAERLLTLMIESQRSTVQKDISSLSMGEKGALLYLACHRDGATAGELSRALNIGTGGVANVLGTLEKKGYVMRAMSATDRRSVVATVTEAGMTLIRRKEQEAIADLQRVLCALGPEDAKELLRLYERAMQISARLEQEKETARLG